MAVDAFIYFVAINSNEQPRGETQDDFFSKKSAFEIKEFSFGIENPATIGSATMGAGGGKAKFNEFTIKKPTDSASTLFFKNCCAGVHYNNAIIAVRKAGGDPGSTGQPFLIYEFDIVFTTKIEWSGPGDEGPEESITFAFGKLGVQYIKQTTTGTMAGNRVVGWDQTSNQEVGKDTLKFLSLTPPS